MADKKLQEQPKISPGDRIKPWQFQPGVSGNPAGRKPGSSLKDYCKKYLSGMTDEERHKFLNGIDKKTIWEMSEGKAAQTVDSHVEVILPKPILDVLEDNSNTEGDGDESSD